MVVARGGGGGEFVVRFVWWLPLKQLRHCKIPWRESPTCFVLLYFLTCFIRLTAHPLSTEQDEKQIFCGGVGARNRYLLECFLDNVVSYGMQANVGNVRAKYLVKFWLCCPCHCTQRYSPHVYFTSPAAGQILFNSSPLSIVITEPCNYIWSIRDQTKLRTFLCIFNRT